MTHHRILFASVALAALAGAHSASAQDIVMRRPIPVSNQTGNAGWHTTEWVPYSGSTPIDRSRACGDYVERREVTCRKDGKRTDEYFCASSPKPASQQPVRLDGGCTYSWDTTPWVDPGASCTLKEKQSRTVRCLRDADRKQMDESFCTGTKPSSEQEVPDFSTCTYSWANGEYVDKGSSCSAAEVLDRDVWCKRDLDGVRMSDDTRCDPAKKPEASKTQRDESACTYRWDAPAEFTDPGAACTRSETHTRPVTCVISLDGAPADDARCAGQAKPDATLVVPDYSTCEYKAVEPGEWTWSSTCSATAVKTRTFKCQRSNDGGEIVADSECQSRGIGVTEDVTEANYSSCSNSWKESGFVDPGRNCGKETWTQDVSCRRDLDQQLMPESSCSAAKPATSDVRYDTSSCSYSVGNWGAWTYASQCSAMTTKTRRGQCIRSDGEVVADGECQSRGKGVTEEVSEANYAGCSYDWSYTDFVGNGCGQTTQTRTATCKRTLDGATVDASFCSGKAKETLSRTVTDYGTCSYDYGAWGNRTWNTQCSSAATWTETRSCIRSDGTAVAASECQTRGKGDPSRSAVTENYDGCAHQWSYSTFSGAGCGQTTQTRTAWCTRLPSGATVEDARCAGISKDALSQTVTNYDACTYDYGAWSARSWNTQCSATANWSQSRTCMRSDGTPVAATECSSRNKGASTQGGTEANYAQCTNNWAYSGWMDPGASCTAAETHTRTSWCRRDLDGATVDDALCAGKTRDALTMNAGEDRSGCTYGWGAFGAWSWNTQCSATAVRTQSRTCYRQDGVAVAPTYCSGSATQSVTEPNYSQCTNNWAYSPFVDPGASCTANETHTRTAWCRRDLDGATVDDSLCAGKTRETLTKDAGEDRSGCSYNWGAFGAWSWNSQCSATATRTQSRTCYRQDGVAVAASYCSGSPTQSVTEPNYSQCTNNWAYSGWMDPGASCTANETYTRTSWCRRDLDGATVDDSLCSGKTRDALTMNGGEDRSGCSYSWGAWSAWTWNSQCSANATQTRTRTCYRQDGVPVAASYCSGPASESATGENYSQCTYSSSQTANQCTNGSQSVTNSCVRVQTGQQVATSFCNLPATQTQACSSYTWATGGFGGFGACQADSRQYQYRDVYCQANNGGNLSRVDDSLCGGGKPTNVNSQSCTYASWQQTGWGGYTSSCGPATRYMNYACVRASDGAVLPDAECSNRYGAKPVVKDSDIYNTSGCTYTPGYGAWGACQNGTQYRTNTCTRNQTGESVDTQTYCGIPASQSQGCQMPTATISGSATFGWHYMTLASKPFSGSRQESERGYAADNSSGFDGMNCDYDLTISYNGETRQVTGSSQPGYDGHMNYSGSCYTGIQYFTIGGRQFQVSASSSNGSPGGYGDVTGQVTIVWR